MSAPTTFPKENRGSRPGSSFFASDLSVTGRVHTTGDLEIDGVMNGEVEAERLAIGPNGRVRATVVAGDMVTGGTVTGIVKARGVTFQDGCHFDGEVQYEQIAVEPDAHVAARLVPVVAGDARTHVDQRSRTAPAPARPVPHIPRPAQAAETPPRRRHPVLTAIGFILLFAAAGATGYLVINPAARSWRDAIVDTVKQAKEKLPDVGTPKAVPADGASDAPTPAGPTEKKPATLGPLENPSAKPTESQPVDTPPPENRPEHRAGPPDTVPTPAVPPPGTKPPDVKPPDVKPPKAEPTDGVRAVPAAPPAAKTPAQPAADAPGRSPNTTAPAAVPASDRPGSAAGDKKAKGTAATPPTAGPEAAPNTPSKASPKAGQERQAEPPPAPPIQEPASPAPQAAPATPHRGNQAAPSRAPQPPVTEQIETAPRPQGVRGAAQDAQPTPEDSGSASSTPPREPAGTAPTATDTEAEDLPQPPEMPEETAPPGPAAGPAQPLPVAKPRVAVPAAEDDGKEGAGTPAVVPGRSFGTTGGDDGCIWVKQCAPDDPDRCVSIRKCDN